MPSFGQRIQLRECFFQVFASCFCAIPLACFNHYGFLAEFHIVSIRLGNKTALSNRASNRTLHGLPKCMQHNPCIHLFNPFRAG